MSGHDWDVFGDESPTQIHHKDCRDTLESYPTGDATLRAIGEQARELHGEADTTVTCPCGAMGPLRLMFRCFFCEVFFCLDCAEDHFEEADGEQEGP